MSARTVPKAKKTIEKTLDPQDWSSLHTLGHQMVDDMLSYLETVRERPSWQPLPAEVKASFSEPLPFEPQGAESTYQDFKRNVLPFPTGSIHPRFGLGDSRYRSQCVVRRCQAQGFQRISYVGTARFLKGQSKDIVCAAVEPEGAEVLAGKTVTKPDHLLQGTGYGKIHPFWDPPLMDLSIAITDNEAEEWRSLLARLEGLYVGYSAAANVLAAVKLLQSGRVRPDGLVATVLCDTGLKYLRVRK